MPNLKHFEQAFVLSDGSSTKTRQSVAAMHRGIRVVGARGTDAFALGDSIEKPAPVFYVNVDTYVQFESTDWRDYDPVLCQEPASAFYVKPSKPVLTSSPSDVKDTEHSVVLGGFYALTIGRGRWVIYELVVDNGQTVGIETIVLLDSDKTWAPVENVGFSICDPVVFEGRTAARADVQKAARNLVSFLYLINSDVGAPVRRERVEAKNRSERRRLARWPEPDIYDVEIRQPNLPLEYVFEDVHAGRRLGPRIAGATRKELKHSANRMSYVSTTERYDQFQRSLRIKNDDHG